VTRWTDKTELFIEHRTLVVGQQTSFAVHTTALTTFKAVTSGTLLLTLTCEGTEALSVRVLAPVSPGIFRPVLTPVQAGHCKLSATLESSEVRDRIDLGTCEVYSSVVAAAAATEEEAPLARVPFLKEQQWTTDFATHPAVSAPPPWRRSRL